MQNELNKHEVQSYSVGIIGYGFVGKAMHHLFPQAVIFDKDPYQIPWSMGDGSSPRHNTERLQSKINACEIVFICVPTDSKEDGSVDLSAIKEVFSWLKGPIAVIKSTVPPSKMGDNEGIDAIYRFADKNYKSTYVGGAAIVFNPEFLTEKNWKSDVDNETRIILGDGSHNMQFAKKVAKIYQKVYGEQISYLYTTPQLAMMTKYVSNAFLATKVAFCNQIADICEAMYLPYEQVRELWLHDKRVGRSHTLISEQKGFGGYCLPKDLKGLIHTARSAHYAPVLLETIDAYNTIIRDHEGKKETPKSSA